jgi:opacity protein-like surface antigen
MRITPRKSPLLLVPATLAACLMTSAPVMAEGNYYLRGHAGFSIAGDNEFAQTGVAAAGATGSGSYGSGFATGIAFGYRYGNGFSAEIDWEYRSNDNDSITFSDGTSYSEGNLASNTFFVNGYYTFEEVFDNVRPYVGAGVGWVQEIDLDLEAAVLETSYTGDSELAWQLMTGIETTFNRDWRLQGELRYTRVADVNLEQENGPGRITGLDYDAWTIGVNLVYDF